MFTPSHAAWSCHSEPESTSRTSHLHRSRSFVSAWIFPVRAGRNNEEASYCSPPQEYTWLSTFTALFPSSNYPFKTKTPAKNKPWAFRDVIYLRCKTLQVAHVESRRWLDDAAVLRIHCLASVVSWPGVSSIWVMDIGWNSRGQYESVWFLFIYLSLEFPLG